MIEETLRHLIILEPAEIIVVDGGSKDQTVSLAKPFSSFVLDALPGRARQCNLGAAHAAGDVLLFLHADSQLTREGFRRIPEILQDSNVVGGAFDLDIRSERPALKIIAKSANIRSRLSGIPYGDQGIFIRKKVFEQLGGFKQIPIMEDVDLARRMKRLGRIVFLKEKITTSDRRWVKEGIFYTTARNSILITLYFLGFSPTTLKRWYSDTAR